MASSLDAHHVFHAFPVELVRDIFEYAASSKPSTACALSLVCISSRSWIEPILYGTVVIESARALKAFAATITTKPSEFVALRVKHLGIFATGPLPAIHSVLSACQGVTSLACGFSLPSYAKQYQASPCAMVPREQHLLSLSCAEGWDPTLLGTSLTHLRIHLTAGSWDPSRLNGLSRLPSLSHLAIVYRQGDGSLAFLLPILREILSDIPLRLLLLQVMGRPPRGQLDLTQRVNHIALEELEDVRLVAEHAPFSTVRQWEDAARRGNSVWSSADMEVARRQASSAP
ncbi:hypothetical protein DENSPDRAFT_840429 [Dentipellis sp. KUC8613]|nr:hypothetical protein DENSPDRAFT_840429 [Dentipellis sp. KUC8613]